jgi:hypothetical protein
VYFASMDRRSELAAIAAFLEDRGPARCPARFATGVALALPAAEEASRLARLQPPLPLTRNEQRRFHTAICHRPARRAAASG